MLNVSANKHAETTEQVTIKCGRMAKSRWCDFKSSSSYDKMPKVNVLRKVPLTNKPYLNIPKTWW